MADLASHLWFRAHQSHFFDQFRSPIVQKELSVVGPNSNVPTWLQIIKLFFNERMGLSVFHMAKYGLNIALVVSSSRGHVMPTILLFLACYMIEC